jgi:hypothetical protein
MGTVLIAFLRGAIRSNSSKPLRGFCGISASIQDAWASSKLKEFATSPLRPTGFLLLSRLHGQRTIELFNLWPVSPFWRSYSFWATPPPHEKHTGTAKNIFR